MYAYIFFLVLVSQIRHSQTLIFHNHSEMIVLQHIILIYMYAYVFFPDIVSQI